VGSPPPRPRHATRATRSAQRCGRGPPARARAYQLPVWIEDEARKLAGTNFVVNSMFKPFAIRDGNLITGQQQYSGAAAARLVIEALGV